MSRLQNLRAKGIRVALILFFALQPLTTLADSAASGLSENYRHALELDPDNAALHYYLGISLLSDGDNRTAITEFKRAYPSYIDSLEMNYNFALVYSRLGDIDNAQLYLDLAESLGARDRQNLYPIVNIWFNLALIAIEQGRSDEAERLLRKVIDLEPKKADAHRLLGDQLARRGKTEAAIQEFHSCLNLDPDDAIAREYLFALYYNRGLALIDRPESAETARKEMTSALGIKPESVMAYYYLGYLDYQAKRYPEALDYLLKIAPKVATEIRENLIAMLYNSGLALQELKNLEKAELVADFMAKELQPKARDLFLAGNIKFSLKKYEAARDLFRRTLQLDAKHRGASFNLMLAEKNLSDELFQSGQQLFQSGNYSEALASFEKVRSINSTYPLIQQYTDLCKTELDREATAFFTQAEAAMAAGRTLDAVGLMRQGLNASPQAARGKTLETTLLAKIRSEIDSGLREADRLFSNNQLEEAKTAFEKTLDLEPDNQTALQGVARIAKAQQTQLDSLATRFQAALTAGQLAEARLLAGDMSRLAPDASSVVLARTQLDEHSELLFKSEARAGQLAFAANRIAEGRQHFNNALALHPDESLQREFTAWEKLYADKLAAILSDVRKAIAKNDFKVAQSGLAQAEGIEPTAPAIVKVFDELNSTRNRLLDKLLSSATTKAGANNWRGALIDYRKTLDLDPTNSQAQQGLRQSKAQLQKELSQLTSNGTSFIANNNLIKAEQSFRQALEIDPYYTPALDGLNQITQQRQTANASGNTNALYLKGIDLYTSGRYEEAVVAWEKVLALSPKHDKARLNIEKARRKLQQIKEYRNG